MKIYLILFTILLSGCNNNFYEEVENSNSTTKLYNFLKSVKKSDLKIPKYKDAVLDKLETFNVSDEIEIIRFAELLGAPVYYNIIVVPDLSNRIIEIKNKVGYDQAEYDKKIVNEIYNILADYKKVNYKSENKDIFTIYLTQETQSVGNPISISFKDLSTTTFDKHRKEINEGLSKLYENAIKQNNIVGNDFRLYFQNQVNSTKLFKSSYKEVWYNKIIILTDGYLEASKQINYTDLSKDVHTNPIPSIKKTFSNLDVMICEVHLRKGDELKNEQLKTYWYDWLKDMHIGNVDNTEWWIQHDINGNLGNTKRAIADFLQADNTSSSSPKTPVSEPQVANKVMASNVTAQTSQVAIQGLPNTSEPVKPTSSPKKRLPNLPKISTSKKENKKTFSDKCTEAYDEIYTLLGNDLTNEEIRKIIKLEDEYLTLGCSEDYKNEIKKNRQALNKSLNPQK